MLLSKTTTIQHFSQAVTRRVHEETEKLARRRTSLLEKVALTPAEEEGAQLVTSDMKHRRRRSAVTSGELQTRSWQTKANGHGLNARCMELWISVSANAISQQLNAEEPRVL